jgi:thiol-disulfide isomerase/thioredoxin
VRRALVAVCAVALLAAGCAPSVKGDNKPFIVDQVGPAKIDVDTPELRAQKNDAGIAACVPGSGHSELPAATLPCLGGGKSVALDSLSGPLVINLWAAWCTICRIEMPIYQQFYEAHGDRVPVLGVDYNDVFPDQALSLLKGAGATFPQIADTQSVLGGGALAANPDRYLPLLALLDADGHIVWVQAIQIHDVGELEDLVREHLGVDL